MCKPVKFGNVTSQRIVIQNPTELREEGSFLLKLENAFILERFVSFFVFRSYHNMKRLSFFLVILQSLMARVMYQKEDRAFGISIHDPFLALEKNVFLRKANFHLIFSSIFLIVSPKSSRYNEFNLLKYHFAALMSF